MKKTVITLLLGGLVLAGCVTNTPEQQAVINDPIRIGFVGPLTGDVAFIGEGIRNGLILASNELGESKYEYELFFEDDRLDPKTTASAVNKLISLNNVDVVITVSSGTGNVASPIAQQNKVIHFGLATDPNVAVGEYNFTHSTPPSELAKAFIKALQVRGITKLGIFQLNQQGTQAIIDSLEEQLTGTNITVTTKQIFNFGETDFRTAIAKAEQTDSEIYLLEAFSPEVEILTKQIEESGTEVPITSIESFELSDQPELFEGRWYISSAEHTNEFIEVYVNQYDVEPGLGAANSYDVFNLIVDAANAVNSDQKPTTDQLVEQLNQIEDFDGALGILNFDENGIVLSPAVVRMIKDAKPVTIEE